MAVERAAEKIIIDTDPGLGCAAADVDDGLAIALALHSPELEVTGLTVTYGNVPLERGLASADRLLRVLGREDVPVLRGAASCRDIDKSTPASDFLIEQLEAAPGQITLVPIGPLTNLGAAERRAPGILKKARRIVCMGGVIWGRGMMPPHMTAEFNFWNDPQAVDTVLNAGADLTLVPFDLTRTVIVSPEYLRVLRKSDTVAGRYLYRKVSSWFVLSTPFSLMYAGRVGFMPHDPLAVGLLLWPELYELEQETVTVGFRGRERARLRISPHGAPISAARSVEQKPFLDRLFDRLQRRAD